MIGDCQYGSLHLPCRLKAMFGVPITVIDPSGYQSMEDSQMDLKSPFLELLL